MRKMYRSHVPSDDAAVKINELRLAFDELHSALEKLCPPSRELSLAITNIEQAAMWATKAVVHGDPLSKMM